MKLKKLFAGIVAVAMMATMAAPVFATSGGETEVPSTSPNTLTLTKTFTVDKGTSPDTQFHFELANDTTKDNENGAPAKESPVPSKHEWDLDFTSAAAGTANATQKKNIELDFSTFGFNHVGRYYYVITERDDSAKYPGVAFDKQPVYMTVNVMNDGAGTGYIYSAVLRKGTNSGNDKITGDKAFTNTYGKDGRIDLVHELSLKKLVQGDFADMKQDFEFEITLTGETGKTYKGATVVKTVNKDGNPKETDIIALDGKKFSVSLGRNDEITFGNLPENVGYVIKETTTGYTLTWNVTADSDNKIDAKMGAADVKIEATNKHEGVPDTGVILDNAPYIALLTIVAAGAVVMIMKKRRNYED